MEKARGTGGMVEFTKYSTVGAKCEPGRSLKARHGKNLRRKL